MGVNPSQAKTLFLLNMVVLSPLRYESGKAERPLFLQKFTFPCSDLELPKLFRTFARNQGDRHLIPSYNESGACPADSLGNLV